MHQAAILWLGLGWQLICCLPTSGYGSLVTSSWSGFRGASRGDDNDKADRGAGGQANMKSAVRFIHLAHAMLYIYAIWGPDRTVFLA